MISVCVAAYNGSLYIQEQIKSILKQLSEDDELIVSDDGSKDNTISLLEAMKDERIKIFRNTGRHGVVANFENALNNAIGDYIFLADQDDVWADDKVKNVMKYLMDYDLVVHNLWFMDSDSAISDQDFFSLHNSRGGFWHNLYRNSFMGSCMAFKSDILKYALPFPKNTQWHDMWIGLIAERHGKPLFLDEKLLYYRRHGDNASTTGSSSKYSLWFQLCFRINMLFNIFYRQ